MARSLRWPVLIALIGSSVLPAAARQSPSNRGFTDQPSIVEQHRTNVSIEDDGSLVYQVATRIRVQNEAGVREHGTVVVPYPRDLSTLDIEYVRVRKASGALVETPVRTAIDVPAEVTREAPVYSDAYERHVNVQGLAAGDVLEYGYRLRERPTFPGHVALEMEFFSNAIFLDNEAQLSVPASRYINVKTQGTPPTVTTDGGRRIYRWRYSNTEAPSQERLLAFMRERLKRRPSVQVSTFRSWDELGAAVKELWRGRAEVTPEIRQKAEELTKGLSNDAEKMQAVFSFVSDKVRYLGVSFGIGRLQPNSAADVLRNGFGDCKDKHVLLEALLRSINISSSPVLIGLGDTTDPDVPSAQQFNHVVTLATLSGGATVWMDGTIELAPPGHMSVLTRNRQGLVVATSGPTRLIATPKESIRPNSWAFHLDGTVDTHGVLRGQISQTVTGDSEVFLRQTFRDLTEARRESTASEKLSPSPLSGKRSAVQFTALDKPTEPLVLRLDFVADGFVDWSDGELDPFVPIPMLGEAPADSNVPFPLVFGATTDQTFSFRIQLPPGFDATFPKNQTTFESSLTPDFGSHRLRLRSANGVLEGERHVRLDVLELPAERTGEYRSFHTAATDSAPVITLRDQWPWTSVSTARIQWPTGLSPEANALVEKSTTASPEQAVLLLEQALKIEPKHPSAWARLGQRQAQMRGTQDGIQSHYRQIEEAPSPAAYKSLGAALPYLRRDEAVRVYREGARVFPDDRDLPALLGEYLIRTRQAAEAIPVLDNEIARRPRSSRLHAFLGRALVLTNEPDKAVASFKRAVELEPGPNILAMAALGLAEANRELDLALSYAERAVNQTLKENTATTLPATLPRGMGDAAGRLAYYWDALGWVHFRKGDIAKAREYCFAAWNLSRMPDRSDHMGQIEEARKDTVAAARYYTHMIVVPAWNSQERIERFNRLVPLADRERVQKEVLWNPPMTAVPAPDATPGRTNVRLLVGLDGVVRDARSSSADAANQPVVRSLIGRQLTPPAAGDSATTIYRTGLLTCGERPAECSFGFVNPAMTVME